MSIYLTNQFSGLEVYDPELGQEQGLKKDQDQEQKLSIKIGQSLFKAITVEIGPRRYIGTQYNMGDKTYYLDPRDNEDYVHGSVWID
jgi:hypothetical protein